MSVVLRPPAGGTSEEDEIQDRPTARELLTDIADILENDVMPAVTGPLQHQVRVAGNLCRIIERDLDLGPAADERERALLSGLLGESGDAAVLNRRLVERLQHGAGHAFERAAWQVLVEVVRGKLAVAKPGHDAYDFGPEVSG